MNRKKIYGLIGIFVVLTTLGIASAVTSQVGDVITVLDLVFGPFQIHFGDITGGGHIPALNDPKAHATFGIVGQGDDRGQGSVEYQDHGPAKLNIKSTNIIAVVTTADKTKGSIIGSATVNGDGTYPFILYVEDNGEPGKGVDKFEISLPTYPHLNGAILSGGNIQIHS